MPQKRSLGLLVNTTRAFEGGELVRIFSPGLVYREKTERRTERTSGISYRGQRTFGTLGL
jgi:hypothetical protein